MEHQEIETEIRNRIEELVNNELQLLAPHLRKWVEDHIVSPHPITMSLLETGEGEIKLWLVTDHTGSNDSGHRVVFDPEHDAFGLECLLQNDVSWYMGRYGKFSDTIIGM